MGATSGDAWHVLLIGHMRWVDASQLSLRFWFSAPRTFNAIEWQPRCTQRLYLILASLE